MQIRIRIIKTKKKKHTQNMSNRNTKNSSSWNEVFHTKFIDKIHLLIINTKKKKQN